MTWMYISRGSKAAVLAAALVAGAGGPAAPQEDALASFRNALIDYFAALNFVPVLVDRGYGVGDVIEADGVNLMARGSQCFPGLTPPAEVATPIPVVVKTNSAAVGFGLKLKQIFDSSAGADLVKNIQLKFASISRKSSTAPRAATSPRWLMARLPPSTVTGSRDLSSVSCSSESVKRR